MSHIKDSPAAFDDVKAVMDIALEKPGLRYVLPTYGAAVNFKQRCYRYRNLLRQMSGEQVSAIPGHRAETSYDSLVIRQYDDEGKPSKKGRHLSFDLAKIEGVLIDPETGEEINILNAIKKP